ncbi:MAG: hypothetical protein BGO70_16250 [Bacteroidetes bacterium 43-93]|nr:MAG: hypothetical protein BGO70_16250 [Bacteroidetes bacterium 43-93]
MDQNRNIETTATNKFLALLISPRYSRYRHISLLLMLSIVAYYMPAKEEHYSIGKAVMFVFCLLLFYINMYVLIPRYLFQNKYLQYFGSIVVCAVLAYLFIFFRDYHRHGKIDGPDFIKVRYVAFVFVTMVFIAATTAIKLFQRWVADSEHIMELQRTKMFAELEQLKNQISPHFLFNMLNNVNVLTQRDPEKASQVLMKLSDFLRYQLYDSSKPKVLLTSEIRFLSDFLNLEKIRRDNFRFTIEEEGDLFGVQVPSMLFTTFIENAIKHSLNPLGSSYVNVRFCRYQDKLNFQCTNSKPGSAVKHAVGGLGLANAKRRLELLFPDHKLTIGNNADTYSVSLILDI